MAAAADRGVTVCGTGSTGSATAEADLGADPRAAPAHPRGGPAAEAGRAGRRARPLGSRAAGSGHRHQPGRQAARRGRPRPRSGGGEQLLLSRPAWRAPSWPRPVPGSGSNGHHLHAERPADLGHFRPWCRGDHAEPLARPGCALRCQPPPNPSARTQPARPDPARPAGPPRGSAGSSARIQPPGQLGRGRAGRCPVPHTVTPRSAAGYRWRRLPLPWWTSNRSPRQLAEVGRRSEGRAVPASPPITSYGSRALTSRSSVRCARSDTSSAEPLPPTSRAGQGKTSDSHRGSRPA